MSAMKKAKAPGAGSRLGISGAGLGLRRELLPQLLERVPAPIGFFEVAPENWMEMGGRYGRQFRELTERHPFVTHGLSLSLGSPAPLDTGFVKRVKKFLDEKSAGEIFEQTNQRLAKDDSTTLGLLKQSRVLVVCSSRGRLQWRWCSCSGPG